MDVDFVVHDAFEAVRSDWKFAKNLQDAGTSFAEACKENYQNLTPTQAVEPDEQDGEDVDMDGNLEARRTTSHDTNSSDEAEVSEGLYSTDVVKFSRTKCRMSQAFLRIETVTDCLHM